MENDNTTPMAAKEYDQQINSTIPYYQEFYNQTLDVIEQCGLEKIEWLDLGCGTGYLEWLAVERFSDIKFILVDPSDKMIEQAKEKLKGENAEYICTGSTEIDFINRFDVVTAIQSHHYMQPKERVKATEAVYRALKKDGIYIYYENVVPEDEEVKEMELLRWGRYQQRCGKSAKEARAHNARCGVNYFPLTIAEHVQLLKDAGFYKIHMFWYSYMQMGIYAIK